MNKQRAMETKLARIAEISKDKPKEIFTSVYHLLNKELLIICHRELNGNKAIGIDGITKLEPGAATDGGLAKGFIALHEHFIGDHWSPSSF